MGVVYVARHGFAAEFDGRAVGVHKGDTADDGHPLVAANPDAWRPQVVTYPYEKPSKPAPRKPAVAKADDE